MYQKKIWQVQSSELLVLQKGEEKKNTSEHHKHYTNEENPIFIN